MKRLLLILVVMLMALPAHSANDKPGDGVTVQPARANWNTGYFQEAVVRAGLKELGYDVKKPKELQNTLFYQALFLGDVDYWVNGWFPMHNTQMPENFYEKGTTIGYVMKAGGLQGYLVSKRDVEKFDIKSLDDFKRPEVKAAFDANGDGKADLTACETGWGCAKTVAHHLEVYDLGEHINPITAGYTASIADTMARYKSGKPVFFYTWAPNWTIFKMKPGEDVMWINVPSIIPREVQKNDIERMSASGIKGAVTDPVKLGFIAADIRAVANKEFLARNPAARRFLELFTLPLEDVNQQNTKMQDGQKSQEDIERHAREWIAANQGVWNSWLTEARAAAR